MSLRRSIRVALPLIVAFTLLTAGRAEAALTVFQQFVGNYGVSSDGFGSTSQSGTISAQIPAGATIVAAYLYTSTYAVSGPGFNPSGTFGGSAVAYSPLGQNATACCSLQAYRANVTTAVSTAYTGAAGIYNFTVTESAAENSNAGQDGEALVVVYSQAALPVSTIGILDGWASASGDTTTINFASGLNPAAPGFEAEMRLGIGFSCCSQQSTVAVNGVTITTAAGNFDDGAQQANGSLITVGGFDDPFSPNLPSYDADHERYNLIPRITAGDTSIVVRTANASLDDNIFLAIFKVSGQGIINPVPEPASMTLLGLGLGAAALRRRFARK